MGAGRHGHGGRGQRRAHHQREQTHSPAAHRGRAGRPWIVARVRDDRSLGLLRARARTTARTHAGGVEEARQAALVQLRTTGMLTDVLRNRRRSKRSRSSPGMPSSIAYGRGSGMPSTIRSSPFTTYRPAAAIVLPTTVAWSTFPAPGLRRWRRSRGCRWNGSARLIRTSHSAAR